MKRFKMILGISMFTAGLVACSSNYAPTGSSSSSAQSSSLSTGTVQQAAQINCNIQNMMSAQSASVHTLDSMDTFFAQTPKQGDIISFDCSGTQDAAGGVKLSVDANYNSAAPNFQAISGQNFQMTLSKSGVLPFAIQAVDAAGLTRVKTFNLIVQCPDQTKPTVNLTGISVVASTKLNYFNYSVAAGAVSGGSGFQYAWDFNGDGVYDAYDMTKPNTVWTSSASLSNIYTIFANQRTIGLKVINSCGMETDVQVPLNFHMDNITRDATTPAVVKPYYYLQADVSDTANASPRFNGDVLVTQYPDDSYQRVICNYQYTAGKPASFTLKAYNWYTGGTQANTSDNMLHGMDLKIQNIMDTGAVSTQSFQSGGAGGIQLSSADYLSSAADDGFTQEIFGIPANGSCTTSISIMRAQGASPCAAGQNGSIQPVVQILGQFDCPTLVAADGGSVAAHNGKFYCQVGPINQCVGGGGGGGGTPPPQQ